MEFPKDLYPILCEVLMKKDVELKCLADHAEAVDIKEQLVKVGLYQYKREQKNENEPNLQNPDYEVIKSSKDQNAFYTSNTSKYSSLSIKIPEILKENSVITFGLISKK